MLAGWLVKLAYFASFVRFAGAPMFSAGENVWQESASHLRVLNYLCTAFLALRET